MPAEVTTGLSDVSQGIVTAVVAISTAIAAAIAYFKKPARSESETEVAVVSAALFSDKSLIRELVHGIDELTKCVEETNRLIRDDLQHRREEQLIRAALAEHGIKQKD